MKNTTIEQRINILKKTIDNLQYMQKLDDDPQTLYDATRWCYFSGMCSDMLIQYETLEEKFEDVTMRIGLELQRYRSQLEEF